MRILVVDDTEILARVLIRILSAFGVVRYAGSVAEAREALSEESYDFILSDVMMPGETGADLHRWLSENRPEELSGLSFMTGGIPDRPTRDYIDSLECPVIEKPFDIRELESLARRYSPPPR